MAERFEIAIQGGAVQFSAAHFLVLGPDSCEPMHGHDFQVEVSLEAPLAGPGWVVDFLLVHDILKKIVADWDHKLLLPGQSPWLQIINDESDQLRVTLGHKTWCFPRSECLVLPILNTTAELLAQHLGQLFLRAVRERCDVSIQQVTLRLRETPQYAACWHWEI